MHLTETTRRRSPLRGFLAVCLLSSAMLCACGPGLYELPDPPPREDWHRHSLNPADDEERSYRDFLAAQDSVLAFVEAMQEHRYDDAYELLSNETRILLDDLSPDGLGESVLSTGHLVRDGVEYDVDPVDLFVVADLEELLDEQPGEPEQETYRRKELWARAADGTVHHIVLIYEDDQWRIHKPSIALTPGSPGRRTLEG